MDQEYIDQVVDYITEYVHGPAREQITAQFEQAAGDIGQPMGQLGYQIVKGAIDKVTQGQPVEIDFVLAVATETLDMLIEIVEAMGVDYNPEKIREESLLEMIQLHMQAVGDDPEQLELAQEALEEMMIDGTYEQAMGATKQLMEKHGVNPAEAAEYGEQMVAPKKDKLASAVSRQTGLMGQ